MSRAADREVTALTDGWLTSTSYGASGLAVGTSSDCTPASRPVAAAQLRAGAYRPRIENRIRAGNTALPSMAA